LGGNNGDRWLAGGTYNKLIVATSGGLTYDITPAGFTAGSLDAAVNTGYGGGFYGTGFYGQIRPTLATLARRPLGTSTTGGSIWWPALTPMASCMSGS
jgi:hypothetical protein